MKVAYASENPNDLELIGGCLRKYFSQKNVEVTLLDSAEALLKSLRHENFQLVLVDMQYRICSGVELVYRIRAFNPSVAVMILRQTDAGRLECIYAKPTLYVADTIDEFHLSPLLDNICGRMNRSPDRTMLFKTVQNICRAVPLTEIVYAESQGHSVFVHLIGGEFLETKGPIRLLAEQLSTQTEFLFPHRSYIVNAFYVSCIMPDKLFIRSPRMTIPIAHGKLASVKQAYEEYFSPYGISISPFPT